MKLSNLLLCLIFTFSFVLFSIASVSAASSYTSSTANAVTVAINPIINISDGNSGTTTVTFGVAVNNGQASGTYTGTVVFTAIAT